jgi:hypothetical protein
MKPEPFREHTVIDVHTGNNSGLYSLIVSYSVIDAGFLLTGLLHYMPIYGYQHASPVA